MAEDVGGKLRVLIVAEHASAKFGGEAILPLHYFRVLRARGVETWLIVHARTREELSRLFSRDLDRITFIPDTPFTLAMHRYGRLLPGSLRHFTAGWLARLSSQYRARRVARRLIAQHGIDVVHQPIPVSPKESSVLYNLGAPVVIGPMNGGMTYPAAFGRSEGGGGTIFTRLARRAAEIINRFMPGKLRAQALLVANDRTRQALPGGVRGRVIPLVENGVDLTLWSASVHDGPVNDHGGVRFVFTGRLVDWKAVDLLLEAFARVRERVPVTLDILGDGPMRASLEAQVRRAGIDPLVRFHGWQPQEQCARHLRESDVFVLPSLYECGGAVVLEAMAVGLPVIATDWGGPADYLDESCGILVPPRSREQFITELAAAMLRLAQSPELRRQMGAAGRTRVVEHFDWERKIDRVLEIYADAVNGGRSGSPSGTLRSTILNR